jgi:hypothetical protein
LDTELFTYFPAGAIVKRLPRRQHASDGYIPVRRINVFGWGPQVDEQLPPAVENQNIHTSVPKALLAHLFPGDGTDNSASGLIPFSYLPTHGRVNLTGFSPIAIFPAI